MKSNAWKLNLDKFRVEITYNLVARVKNTVPIYLEKYRILYPLKLSIRRVVCLKDTLQFEQKLWSVCLNYQVYSLALIIQSR